MLVLQLIKTGYKLGTFAIMPRQYRKDYISKNGNNYYLQFHIAEWMRQLPAFREYPNNKKNYTRTLKSSDPHEAARKAEAILLDLQIKHRPTPKALEQGADAYFHVLKDIETRSDEELLTLQDEYQIMFDESLGPAASIGESAAPDIPEWYDHSHNTLTAIKEDEEA